MTLDDTSIDWNVLGDAGIFLVAGDQATVLPASYSMVGLLDEMRISGSAFNSTWIALEYALMTGTLASPVMDP